MSTHLTYQEAALHYNLCIFTSAHFRYSAIKLHEKEELELRRFYESTTLRKLEFYTNFSSKLMHVSKEILGLGLLLPSIIIAIQGLKLYLENKDVIQMCRE